MLDRFYSVTAALRFVTVRYPPIVLKGSCRRFNLLYSFWSKGASLKMDSPKPSKRQIGTETPQRRSDSPKGKHKAKPVNKMIMPLFGKEGVETSHVLKKLVPISDRWIDNENDVDSDAGSAKEKLENLKISTAMSCTTCGITFESREEQIEHFKADWHRFNIKQRVKGASSVTEMAFTEMADNISSLSGTDFTDSEVDEDIAEETFTKTRALATRVADSRQSADSSDDEAEAVVLASKQNKLYMKSSSGQILSMYRAVLFHKKEQPDDINALLNRIEQLPQCNLWIIMVMGGGHFAAAVFDNGEVVAHKTFHRYVVRAKAGRAQSQHDKQGGHAQSAGAQIRRHNEAALGQEITDLLESWRSYIDGCHRIFLRVATHNYPYIFNKKEKSHINKHDQRIRTVPFPTKRATFSEVKRIYTELSSIKIIDSSTEKWPRAVDRKKKQLASKRGPSIERRKRQGDPGSESKELFEGGDDEMEGNVELSFHDDTIDTRELLKDYGHFIPSNKEIAQERTAEKKKSPSASKTTSSTKTHQKKDCETERQLLPFQSEFYTACTLGNKEQLEDLVQRHCGDNSSSIISLPVDNQGHTLLHIACHSAHAHLVSYLLGIGCDPSNSNDKNVVPYLSTQNKSLRTEFRIFMGEYPDKFDYDKAQIPGPLTKEMAAEKEARESERRRELNKKKKEKSKAKRAESAVQRAEEEERRRFLSLSDREKRALAAEKRLLETTKISEDVKVVLNRCYQCADDITGKVPFEYSNNTFCSPTCLKKHRMALKKS